MQGERAVIKIDMDARCSKCGEKGATPNGLCLKCHTDIIVKGGCALEVKVMVRDIQKLKTTTKIQEEEEKDKQTGEVIDRRLVTKLSFEAEIPPGELANVHRLLAAEFPVHVLIGSPQEVMALAEKEGTFATA
jgi:hypothetical protein